MLPQVFERTTHLVAATVTLVVMLLAGTSAVAQSASLDDAVSSLREGNYEHSLELLEELDASADPRVDYYRGYALEKLGECDAAGSSYERAAKAASNQKLRGVASDALGGLDARCVPVKAASSDPSPQTTVEPPATAPARGQAPRGAGRVGWKVFGWTTAILGGVVLTGIPVKSTIENRAFDRTTPYFEERYGCDVNSGEVDDGASCDKAALSDDPVYEAYEQNQQAAATAQRVMLIGGTTLVGVGVGTLLTVALTRPSAPVQWSLAPADGGIRAGAVIHF